MPTLKHFLKRFDIFLHQLIIYIIYLSCADELSQSKTAAVRIYLKSISNEISDPSAEKITLVDMYQKADMGIFNYW